MDVPELLAGLSDPAAFPEHGPTVEVIQTHVSVVFLTGDRVYKVKKPVSFWGFLDYSTAERRRVACEEEVRLNRRTAPGVYLGVLPVVRRGAALAVGEPGKALEHAVVMRRIPAGATLAERVRAGTASLDDVASLARVVARFHASAERGPDVARAGRPVVFARVLVRNARTARTAVTEVFPAGLLAWFAARTAALLRAHRALLRRRTREGRLVEGHGDLRAEHAVRHDDPAGPPWLVIDGIEFTTMLRCIDPVSDAAFLAADLASLGRRDLGAAFLAAYLAEAPDPDAPTLLPFFLAYRAHVRAMVEALRAGEPEVPPADRAAARLGARRRLALAWSYAREGLPPPLVVLVGPSGAGKSAIARAAAAVLGATVVQSDEVRKRLAGLSPTARVAGEALAALYAPETSRRTYEAVLAEGERSLAAGRPTVLDATFLRRDTRAGALEVARRRGAPLAFVDVRVTPAVARARIEARASRGGDPSDATFDVHLAQRRETEPFTPEEAPFVLGHDGEAPPDELWMPLLERLIAPTAVPAAP